MLDGQTETWDRASHSPSVTLLPVGLVLWVASRSTKGSFVVFQCFDHFSVAPTKSDDRPIFITVFLLQEETMKENGILFEKTVLRLVSPSEAL